MYTIKVADILTQTNATVCQEKPKLSRQRRPKKSADNVSTPGFTCRHCGTELEGNFVCIKCTATAIDSDDDDDDPEYVVEPKPAASKNRRPSKKLSSFARPKRHFCTECRRNYATLDFLKDHGQFVHQPPLQRKRKRKHQRTSKMTTAAYSIVRHDHHAYVLLVTDPLLNNGQSKKLPTPQEITAMISEWESENSGQYDCPKCSEEFGSLDSVNDHLATVDHKQNTDSFCCDECDIQFESWNAAQMHRINVQHAATTQPIDGGRPTDESANLQTEQPNGDTDDSDSESFKKFMQSFRSDDEEDSADDGEVEWLIDDSVCGEPKIRSANDVVAPADDKKCSYCNETFRSKLLREVHEQFKHKLLMSDMKRHTSAGADYHFGNGNWCKYCRRYFATRKTLSHHLQTKHGKTMKTGRYKCRLCRQEFGLTTARTQHERDTHANAKTFEYHCDKCDKAYRRPELLAAHLLSHDDIKPFICDICGRSFTMDKYLRQHKELHQDNGTHTCDICQRSFNRPYSLTKHKRIHDPTSRKQCDLCGKSFADPRDFQRHLFSHGKHDKEFACHLCAHQAYIQTDLNRHLRTIHRIYQPDFKTRAPIC